MTSLSSLMAFLIRVAPEASSDDEGEIDSTGLGVERLAEFHDVEAALTQCGTDRGWLVFTSWHLQLDEADDFLLPLIALCG